MLYCDNCIYWINCDYGVKSMKSIAIEEEYNYFRENNYRNSVRAELLNVPVLLNGVNISSNQFPTLNYRPYGAQYSYIYIPAIQLSKVGAVIRWNRAYQGLTINLPQVDNSEAMQRDIDFLKEESLIQKDYEDTYNSLPYKSKLKVIRITGTVIQFEGRPLISTDNFIGRYTEGESYSYFEDADMGGKRYIIIKDNFGVWHVFMYIE